MSRARDRKQEEKIAFLTENPDLIEYDTNLMVVRDGSGFAVDARDGLGQPLPAITDFTGTTANEITITDVVQLPDGDLSVSGSGDFVGLTETGFGVVGSPEDTLSQFRAINDDEVLSFDAIDPLGPAIAVLNGGFMTFGITDLLIEYTVLNDEAGTITLAFDGVAPPPLHLGNGLPVPGPTPPVVIDVAAGSENTTGSIEVDAPYGAPFGGWDFTVDGDVDVAVTGISYTTEGPDFSLI